MSHTRIAVLLHYNHPVRMEQTLPPSVTFSCGSLFTPFQRNPFVTFFLFYLQDCLGSLFSPGLICIKGGGGGCVCVWCGVVCLDVKTRRSHTVLAPHHFMACGSLCPSCFQILTTVFPWWGEELLVCSYRKNAVFQVLRRSLLWKQKPSKKMHSCDWR